MKIEDEKSLSQDNLKSEAEKDRLMQIRDNFVNITKNFSSTIVTAVLSIMVVLVSLYTFSQQEGASIEKMFADAWNAILTCVRIVLPPIITVLMSFNFMNSAYKNANEIKEVKKWREEYETMFAKGKGKIKVIRPEHDRSLSKGKSILTKGITALLTGIMTTQLLIEMKIAGLIAALIQLGIALALGFYTYTSTYQKETVTYLAAYKYWIEKYKDEDGEK